MFPEQFASLSNYHQLMLIDLKLKIQLGLVSTGVKYKRFSNLTLSKTFIHNIPSILVKSQICNNCYLIVIQCFLTKYCKYC